MMPRILLCVSKTCSIFTAYSENVWKGSLAFEVTKRIYVKMFARFALLSFFVQMRSSKINFSLFAVIKKLLGMETTRTFSLITLLIFITNFRKHFQCVFFSVSK